MVTIRAHYDGKVFVPEEPVSLPIGPALRLQVVAEEEPVSHEVEAARRKAAFEDFLSRPIHAPDIPLEYLRRENLYEDR